MIAGSFHHLVGQGKVGSGTVFTHAQWDESEKNQIIVSAAPIGPSELGRNKKFVFALPPRYNSAFPDGFQEVDEIMRRKPLRAFN